MLRDNHPVQQETARSIDPTIPSSPHPSQTPDDSEALQDKPFRLEIHTARLTTQIPFSTDVLVSRFFDAVSAISFS